MKFVKTIAAATCSMLIAGAAAAHSFTPDQGYAFDVVRHGMMITPEMLPGDDGLNINGPTVIKAPEWLKSAPGKYLMYFAHHTGSYIRLAYADKLTGPWKIYKDGVMNVGQLTKSGLKWGPDHVASPEIWIDNEKKELRMYFHTPTTPAPKFDDPDYKRKVLTQKQATFLATSKDGLNWTTNGRQMGDHYLRVFPAKEGGFWGFSRLGQLNYSHDGIWRFYPMKPGPIDKFPATFAQLRHPGLLPVDDGVLMFYSKIGDRPESILVTKITVNGEDWTKWTAEKPKLVLTPETDYEGAKLPITPGALGSSAKPERGLRDPFLIRDDGKTYMFYTVQGEKGIALVELKKKAK